MTHRVYGVILAGGTCDGRCPLNRATLPALAPIANQPLVGYARNALRGIDMADVAVCFEGDRCEPPANGAHAVVLDASVIAHFNVQDFVNHHLQTGAAITVAQTSQTKRSIDAIVISPPAACLMPELVNQRTLESIQSVASKRGLEIDIHTVDGCAPRLTDISSYFAMNAWAMRRAAEGLIDLEGYIVKGETLAHVDAHVDRSARLLGPVIVGPEAVIRGEAIISGPSSVGAGSVIGAGAVVSRSAVWTHANIQAGAEVDDCIVADGGSVAANERVKCSVVLPADRTPGDAYHEFKRFRGESPGGIERREHSADGRSPVKSLGPRKGEKRKWFTIGS